MLSFYLGAPDLGTPVLETVVPLGLRPGGFEDFTVPWQFPSNGTTEITAVIDDAGRVEECDETDNRASFVVSDILLADLVAESLTVPAMASVGQLVPATVRVSNDGLATALGLRGVFLVEAVLDPPPTQSARSARPTTTSAPSCRSPDRLSLPPCNGITVISVRLFPG